MKLLVGQVEILASYQLVYYLHRQVVQSKSNFQYVPPKVEIILTEGAWPIVRNIFSAAFFLAVFLLGPIPVAILSLIVHCITNSFLRATLRSEIT